MRLNYVRRCTPGVTDIYAHSSPFTLTGVSSSYLPGKNDAARDGIVKVLTVLLLLSILLIDPGTLTVFLSVLFVIYI